MEAPEQPDWKTFEGQAATLRAKLEEPDREASEDSTAPSDRSWVWAWAILARSDECLGRSALTAWSSRPRATAGGSQARLTLQGSYTDGR